MIYDIHTRTRTFYFRSACRVHTKPYPGYLLRVLPYKNFCNFCRTLIPVPGTSGSSVRPYHNTRNFWMFRKTFIPVPGTCVSSGRPVPQYPGYGYIMFCTRPDLLEVLYACATIPGTSGSSETLPNRYPESANPTELQRARLLADESICPISSPSEMQAQECLGVCMKMFEF